MKYIYAIVRDRKTSDLRIIEEEIIIPDNAPISELRQSFSYAYGNNWYGEDFLGIQYQSWIPDISPDKELTDLWRRKNALGLRRTRDKIQAYYDVVAMSHRFGGWHNMDWNFGKGVSFHVYTNFGFGSVSDFSTTFKYKDVILAPYSYYVKYKYSTVASVVRCTYQYELYYDQWENVLNDCFDFYNAVINDNQHYIFKWIDQHLSIMVSGLEELAANKKYTFCTGYMNIHNIKSNATEVNGNDFWLIKSEKIANSLEFIENIKILPLQIDSKGYIERLYKLCKDFQPKLQRKIATTQKTLSKQETVLEKIKKTGDYPIYEIMHKKTCYKLRPWYAREIDIESLSNLRLLIHLKKRHSSKSNPSEIKKRLDSLKELINQADDMENEISKTKKFLTPLVKNREILCEHIEKYRTLAINE
ncbi:MAG: hypothetical protein IKQ94_00855 [Bacteroidales bacterium]|nr:hypothetical protein [Bacteroidales bacterium]